MPIISEQLHSAKSSRRDYATSGRISACIATALLLVAAVAQAEPVVGVATLPKVSVGEEHMLLLKTDGSVWSWGQNYLDRLGQGTGGVTGALPKQVTGLSGVVSIAAGSSYSMALKADGTVWAWGNNSDGVFGSERGSNVPIQIPGLSAIVGIDVGRSYSAYAIDLSGNAYGWGYNGYANIGTGPSSSRNDVLAPQRIAGLSDIVDLRAGGVSAAALSRSGKVYSWGGFSYAAVGEVPGVANAVAIGLDAVNTTHPHFAVLGTGGVVAWGDTNSPASRCSQSSTIPAPAVIAGLSAITAVASGNNIDLFLDSAGQAWSCGGGSDGTQGDGTAIGTNNSVQAPKPGPLRVSQGTAKFVNVATGYYASAAIAQDGSVWTWGRQTTYGLLGTGNLAVSTPVLAPAKIGITAGDPAKVQPVYAGTQSAAGIDGTSTVDVGVMFAPEHWSKTGQGYLAALLPTGHLFTFSAAGWTLYDPKLPIPAVHSGSLKGMLPLAIGKMNFSALAGTQVIVGYGLGSGAAADLDMLGNGRFQVALTLR